MFRLETILAGTLSDLEKHMELPSDLGLVRAVLEGGGQNKSIFKIPWADNGPKSVIFLDRELLSRFCTLSISVQRDFLAAINATLDELKVERVQIRVTWSTNKDREMLVTRVHGDLSFELI